MKYKHFWIGSLALSLCSGLDLASSMLQANAAGFDDMSSNSAYPGTSEAVNVPSDYFQNSERPVPTNNSQFRSQPSSEPILTWRNWSKPYMQGDVTCRENNGNIVCLSPGSTSNMRW